MIYKVAFTLCVLMYNIVLYMVYFSKQEFKGIRNRVYSMLIINTITICASEILYVIFLGNNMEFVASIFYKVYLFSTVIWTCFSMLYIYSIFEKKSLKTNTYKEIIIKNKTYLIIFSVVSLILIILENAKLNKNNLVFFQDNIFCIILLVIMAIIYLVFNN